MTVKTIRSKLSNGDRFNTYSPSTGRVRVRSHKDTCDAGGCHYETIQSDADAIEDNNLDNLICL